MLKVSAMWILRLLQVLLVCLLIIVAAYVSVGRYYIGYVEKYQQLLVEELVERSGFSFQVDRLHGRWSKLAPILTVENLEVFSSETDRESVLIIDSLNFNIDIIRSIFKRSIQIQNLYIDGVKCSLLESQPGQWQLKGYPVNFQGGGDPNKLIDLLLSVRGAELLAANIELYFYKGSKALLSVDELSLKHSNDFRRIKLQANFDESENPLTAILEAYGDPRKQKSFNAKAYVKLDDIDFAAQLPVLNAFDIDLKDAHIDAEFWLDWLPNTIVTIQGNISTPEIDIAAFSGEPLQPLKNTAMNFRAEKTSHHEWQVWIPSFSSQWQDLPVQLEKLHIKADKDHWGVSLSRLDLAQTSDQFQSIELFDKKLNDIVKTLDASGQLENIWLTLPRKNVADTVTHSSADEKTFSLLANLNDVSVSPWKGAPGAKGVSGYLEVLPTAGKVELDSQSFSLEFPKVYQSPLEFQSALGHLGWKISDGRVILESGPLQLTADHGPATALLSLDIPIKANTLSPPMMNLLVGLRDTDAAYRNKFIPSILNEGFLEWIKESVPEGHVNEAGLIYRGSLKRGDKNNRTVQLYFDIENTALAYHPDWPSVTDIKGLIEVNDAEVTVTTTKAKMFGLDIPSAVVEARPEKEGGMWLTVDASAKGNSRDALRIVNESAIQTIVGAVFKDWELNGDVHADIALGIPLAGVDKESDINVDVHFADGDLAIPEYNLSFSNVGGGLFYSSKNGISSSDLVASLYNKPLNISINQNVDNIVKVLIDGRIDMRDVQAWTNQSALIFTDGETDFSAQITIDKASQSGFTMQSDLRGVDIDLPAPFNKTADQVKSFWLLMPFENKPLVKMGLDNLAEFQLQFNDGAVESGLVIVDKTGSSAHEAESIVVTGKLDKFILQEWQPVLDRYQQAQLENKPLQKKSAIENLPEIDEQSVFANEVSEVSDENQSGLQFKVRQFYLNEFVGFDQQLEDSVVDLQFENDGWLITTSSRRLEGDIFIPGQDLMPIRVVLKHLYLPEGSSSDKETSESLQSFEKLKLDFSVDNLFIGEKPYGQLAFNLRREERSAIFNNVYGNIRGLIVDKEKPLTLEWLRTEAGDKSRLYGGFHFTDLAKVLNHWNYEEVISSEKGSASINLNWPGSPAQWSLASSTGAIGFKINNGRFLKASDTATSTMKVVGIVNFMNIVRRLKLDFSDLYQSGISFDKIQGGVSLANSQLSIADELQVTSPSSRFYLRGDADLIAKQLDMELIATLPVASNLPWIVALAGGLPTAAGVYLASKIFEDQVDSFSSAIYSLSGDWNNPDMQFKQLFDDGKKPKTSKPTNNLAESEKSIELLSTDSSQETNINSKVSPDPMNQTTPKISEELPKVE